MNDKAWEEIKKSKYKTEIEFLGVHYDLTNKVEREKWHDIYNKAIIFVFESLLAGGGDGLTWTTPEGVRLLLQMLPREQKIKFL